MDIASGEYGFCVVYFACTFFFFLLLNLDGWTDRWMDKFRRVQCENVKKKKKKKKKKKNGCHVGPQRARSGFGVFPLLLVISGQRSRGLSPAEV